MKLLLDIDPGVDDALGLIYLASANLAERQLVGKLGLVDLVEEMDNAVND